MPTPVRGAAPSGLLRPGHARALRDALADDRRRRGHLFGEYAADPDPEPGRRWIAIDWDAGSPELRRQAPELVAHPQCPAEPRALVAIRAAPAS
ncbi:hypothetical protein [Streptomyces sp. NPDC037389]|uniref:hypothetical protein n=1 Tax=Streptomyces sp. NPDC037389 TaxID=3155369 RepID=UPI0033DC4FFC